MYPQNHRATEDLKRLAGEAHKSVQLLLALGEDIAEPEPAAACITQSNSLAWALFSVLERCPTLLHDPKESPVMSQKHRANPDKPGFRAHDPAIHGGQKHG